MTQKTALLIRHVPQEGIAGFREPLEAAGFAIDRIDVTDPGFSQIDLCSHDLLVMMGGPMSVYESDRYPWITCQLRRLAKRLEADLPTLGVCFGAQMIAAALGARVHKGATPEVGFHALALHEGAKNSPLRHLKHVPVLHWHGDTFELPAGTELLASSHIYENQAFRRGHNLLALQFHAEMGQDQRFFEWLENWPETIAEARRSKYELVIDHHDYGAKAVLAGQQMIAEWLAQLHIRSHAGWKEEFAAYA